MKLQRKQVYSISLPVCTGYQHYFLHPIFTFIEYKTMLPVVLYYPLVTVSNVVFHQCLYGWSLHNRHGVIGGHTSIGQSDVSFLWRDIHPDQSRLSHCQTRGTFKLTPVPNVLLRFTGWTTYFLETVCNGVEQGLRYVFSCLVGVSKMSAQSE